jgi:hypothetical protein
MPKKTKKQKIIAEYRRQLKLLKEKEAIANQEGKDKTKINSFSISKKDVPTTKQSFLKKPETDESLHQVRSYFINDFKKSFFLTTIIIAIELFIYYAKILK